MAFYLSRRTFISGSAKAGLAAAAVASGATLGISPVAMAQPASVPLTANTDLIHALGARIGLEVAKEIGTPAAQLTLTYLDSAGPSLDALRQGLETGAQWENGICPLCRETPASYSSVLGVAVFRNPETGRSASVEIYPSALTVLSSIESSTGASSVHKLSVMTAESSAMYRIDWA